MTRHLTKREGHWWDQHRKQAGVARGYMVRVHAVDSPCARSRIPISRSHSPATFVSQTKSTHFVEETPNLLVVISAELRMLPNERFCSPSLNPLTATGYFDIPPPRWPTFLVTLFPILKEGMGLSLLDEFEVQYHVIKK